MKKTAPSFSIHTDTKHLTLFDAVLFIMAISFLCLFLSQFSLIIVANRLYVVLFVVGILYFLVHWFWMPYHWIFLAGSHLFILCCALIMKDHLIDDIHTILYSTQVPVDIPYFVSVVSLLLLLWIFTFMFVLYQPVFLFIMICILMGFLTVTGVNISFLMLLSFFIFTFLLLVRKYPSKQNILSLLVLCILIFPVGLFTSNYLQKPLSDQANRLEHFLHETFQDQNGDDRILSSGMVSLGNNYASDEIVFTAQMETKPESNIYLKNFTGFLYEENQWSQDDVARQIDEVGDLYSSYLSPYQYRNYQARIRNALTDQLDMEPQMITILPEQKTEWDTTLTPYDLLTQWNQNQSTTYSFYPGLNHVQNLDSLDLEEDLEQFIQYDQSAAQRLYHSVDMDALPRLAKLVEDNPKTDLNEITAFIVKLLENYTEYTRTPGYMSSQEDAVESFLFSTRKGYCVHYASAAALIYRMYGISSRYVTGYVIYPQDFTYEQGSFMAEVPENHSHAWIELYFPRYGWIPIDMTPDAHQEIHVEYPGLDEETLQQLIAQDRSDFSSLQNNRNLNYGFSSVFRISDRVFILLFVGGISITVILLLIHYFYKKRKKETFSTKEYMDHILHLFSIYPSLKDIDLLDEKNIDVILHTVPALSLDTICLLQQKAQLIYYSPYIVERKDLKRLEKCCQDAILSKLPFWKRIFYHYIYCLY